MAKSALLLWLALTAALHAQAVLSPPFGLKWGDSPERLIEWAGRHELDVRITLPGKKPDERFLSIDSPAGKLPASEARAIEARFHSGRLYEVTIHHGSPGEGADRVEGRFNAERKRLTAKHGPFKINQAGNPTIENQFDTRTFSYHREPVKGLFLNIVFTEMEDLLRKTKEAVFSVVYRNDNLLQQLEAAAAAAK